MEQIYRLHYRAQLKENCTESELRECVEECKVNIKKLQQEGRVLTAALYYHNKMLFLYYEALGELLEVVEPIAAGNGMTGQGQKVCQEGMKVLEDKQGVMVGQNAGEQRVLAVLETGEDVQTTAVHPSDFLAPLAPFLMTWPGQQEDRLWVHMYHIFYHDIPKSVEYWRRAGIPEQRKGRIAFLRDDKLFSYVYHHRAIVDEGLLTGDRYQSIALHENILFSYFEEPKTLKNIRNSYEERPKVIEGWIAVDPESHFIHMPQGEGENFMFLPSLFAMGVEDLV